MLTPAGEPQRSSSHALASSLRREMQQAQHAQQVQQQQQQQQRQQQLLQFQQIQQLLLAGSSNKARRRDPVKKLGRFEAFQAMQPVLSSSSSTRSCSLTEQRSRCSDSRGGLVDRSRGLSCANSFAAPRVGGPPRLARSNNARSRGESPCSTAGSRAGVGSSSSSALPPGSSSSSMLPARSSAQMLLQAPPLSASRLRGSFGPTLSKSSSSPNLFRQGLAPTSHQWTTPSTTPPLDSDSDQSFNSRDLPQDPEQPGSGQGQQRHHHLSQNQQLQHRRLPPLTSGSSSSSAMEPTTTSMTLMTTTATAMQPLSSAKSAHATRSHPHSHSSQSHGHPHNSHNSHSSHTSHTSPHDVREGRKPSKEADVVVHDDGDHIGSALASSLTKRAASAVTRHGRRAPQAISLSQQASPRSGASSSNAPGRSRHAKHFECLVEEGRSVEDLIRRRHPNLEGLATFDAGEIARMQRAFRRVRTKDASEVERNDLARLFSYLGYLGVSVEMAETLAKEVSDYSTYSFNELTEIADRYAPHEPWLLLEAFNRATGVPLDQMPLPPRQHAQEVHSKHSKFLAQLQQQQPQQQQASPSSNAVPPVPPTPSVKFPELTSPGRLNRHNLLALLRGLGFTVRTAVVAEVWEGIGIPQDQEDMSWDEFLLFVTVCQSQEGFLAEEITVAKQIFDASSGKRGLPTEQAVDTLASIFGLASIEEADRLARNLRCGPHEDEGEAGEDGEVVVVSPQGSGEVLCFHDILVMARMLRESLLDTTWREFKAVAKEGHISMQDASEVVHRMLGITMLRTAVREFASEETDTPELGLDFDAFVRFVDRCRQLEGFASVEIKELNEVFQRFDSDVSGEIESIELLSMLRYLGFSTSLEVVHGMVKVVDANQSGGLDFQEYLRLMRAHRELELEDVQAVFASHAGIHKSVPLVQLPNALADFGWNLDRATVDETLSRFAFPETLSFDDFFEASQACRRLFAASRRRMAGFGVVEVQFFEGLFDAVGGEGVRKIDWAAFEHLLSILGTKIQNLNQRKELFEILECARVKARAVGVEEEFLGKPGDQSSISFLVAMHLIRELGQRCERASIEREVEAMEATKYSHADVSGFREVFYNMLEHGKPMPGNDDPRQGASHKSKRPSLATIPAARASLQENLRSSQLRSSQYARQAKENLSRSLQNAAQGIRARLSGPLGGPTLTFAELCELLRCLGLRPTTAQRTQLSDIVAQLTADGLGSKNFRPLGSEPTNEAVVDFAAFLRTMHWMSKVDFAHVNQVTARILNGK